MKKLIVLCSALFASLSWGHSIPGVTDVRVIQHEGKKVELLTNVKGLTLYTFDPDGASVSNCYDSCATAWPPIFLTKDQLELVKDDFSVVQRKDGTFQLAYDSHPLYLYIGDKKPGDVKGDGLGGVWHLAIDED